MTTNGKHKVGIVIDLGPPPYKATTATYPDVDLIPADDREELEALRRHLIGAVRCVDRLLGNEQTIPERVR